MFPKRSLTLALLLCSPPAVASAEETTAGWTPEHSLHFRQLRQTAVSPDGRWVAYVVRTPVVEGERSDYVDQIWVARSDGSSDRQYTRGERSSTAPAFSPDGRYLAFLSSAERDQPPKGRSRGANGEEDKQQIWRMPLRGGEAEQLTDAPASIASFQWSPDGSRIAVVMPDPETEEEKAKKKEKRDVQLVDQEYDFNHLYLLEVEPAEGGEREIRRLTEGSFHVTAFDWSPNGERLVFAHQPDPRLNTGFVESDLALVTVAAAEVVPLVNRPGVDGSPLFSPDGSTVAFTSNGGQVERVGLDDVFLIAAGGGEPRPLAHTPDRRAELVAWSTAGNALLLAEAAGTTRQLYALPANGDTPRRLTDVEGVLGAISTSHGGGRLAYSLETSDVPPEIHTRSLSPTGATSGEPLRLSSINAEVPLPPMGRTELLGWRSKDGLEIEGLLTYPVDYVEGRRYPLILNIHGGPSGVFSQTFTGRPSIYLLQFFAERGYAVLRPNPRGSTGYGKEFRYANVRDWGYGDYEDVMAGVDRVVELGIGDPEQLFVMGWSYGGYLTSYVITRTDRFRAASMGAGLPNLVSMVHTTDIPDYLAAHMGAELWEDYEVYEKHSAMYRLKNVTTPTQIIHGARDLRVPFTQGQELYVGLQRLGVPTEMVVYPRTPHGPREPKFLIDVSPRILEWFERHGDRGGESREPTGASP